MMPYLVDNAFPILNFIGIILVLILHQYMRAAWDDMKAATLDMKKALDLMKAEIASRTTLAARLEQYLTQQAHVNEDDGQP